MKFFNKIKVDLDKKIEKEEKEEKRNAEKLKIKSIVDGKILISSTFLKFTPLLIVLVLLSIFYINNRFDYEAKVKENNELKDIRNDLQTTELVKMSKLNEVSTRSAVIRKLREMNSDVEEPQAAPIVISE